MRIDGPSDLTEGQKRQMSIAGVPANRPGLGAEYPKMVYRPGENPRHLHLGETLPIGNGAHNKVADKLEPGREYETAFVDDAADEAEALENGWFLSADPEQQQAQSIKMDVDRAKDDEIAALRAQLAERDALLPLPVSDPALEKRGPGRPRSSDAI